MGGGGWGGVGVGGGGWGRLVDLPFLSVLACSMRDMAINQAALVRVRLVRRPVVLSTCLGERKQCR